MIYVFFSFFSGSLDKMRKKCWVLCCYLRWVWESREAQLVLSSGDAELLHQS